MTNYDDIAKALQSRLSELTLHVAEIASELQSSLPADWEEQATKLEDQDALEGIEKSKRLEIQKIKDALQRIEQGSYGYCAKCGEEIDPRRLRALPTAITCIACAG